MIESLELINFKGFNKISIGKINNFTLIGGKNNVGKTNLLEAIFLFYDRNNPEFAPRLSGFRGIKDIVLSPESMWAPIFYKCDLSKEISIVLERDKRRERLIISTKDKGITGAMQIKPRKEGIAQVKENQASSKLQSLNVLYDIDRNIKQKMKITIGQQGLSYNLDSPAEQTVTAIFLGARVRNDPNEDASRYGQLDVLGQEDKIVKYLNKLDSRIQGVSSITIANTAYLHVDIGIGRKIPVSFVGEGITRLLSILLAITSAKDGVVLIDEIENGIHHSVLSKILSMIAEAALEYNCQVICTTHSYDCLKATIHAFKDQRLSEGFTYMRIEKKNINNTDLFVEHVFDYDTLNIAIEQDWEVR